MTLADWIGSDATRFPFLNELDPDYWTKATRNADAAISAFGLDPSKPREALDKPPGFKSVAKFPTPNPQQKAVGALDLEARLTILESETGSGKTEAALWRFAQLFHAGKVDALYFAVPTRAAAVQLHRRTCDAVLRLFGDNAPQAVLAAPGYLRAGAVDGTPLPGWRTRWDDGDEEGRHSARWAAERSNRYLAALIAVGTVDQAMLGALKVKYAHLRASSLSRALMVIDEVHASDAFMTEVQRRLLDAHIKVGGYAMLMSATLGSAARSKWLRRPQPNAEEAIATPYPAIWTDRMDQPIEIAQNPRAEIDPKSSKSVRMETLSTMSGEETARHALKAANDGARVLVIRNTVASAVETYKAVDAECGDQSMLLEVKGVRTLHHSRFAPTDRRLLDQAVEETLSNNADKKRRGRIVIGTQTLEQSLDIDADFLLTDLCPIDVLLQRIGRLHRHDLTRPKGFKTPRCMVMTPENGLDALVDPPRFENGLGGWVDANMIGGVYLDLPIVELTRRLIDAHQVWEIPTMNRRLVESATHPERVRALIDEKGPSWDAYQRAVVGKDLASLSGAKAQTIDRTRPFSELVYPSEEEKIRTRLGAEG
ncbi:MAG: CRISPR-associated helicase Cas3', partial [Pseudomonadota bacterium]